MSDLITVIIPIYNVGAYVEATIESLLAQSYKNIEIILVDDGSTDGSGAICDKYAGIDKRIKVIHKANGGVSSARNAGLEEAKGEYVAFVDGDDIVSADYIKSLYEMLKENDVDMSVQVYYNMFPAKKEKSVAENIDKVMSANEFMEFEILGGRDTSVYVKLYRLEIIQSYNVRFDENITNLEDMLFLFQYLSRCNRVFYDTNQVNYYRIIRRDGVVFSKFQEHKLTAFLAREYVYDALLARNDEKLLTKELTLELQDGIGFLVAMHSSDYKGEKVTYVRNYIKKCIVRLKGNLSFKNMAKIVMLFFLPDVYMLLRKLKTSKL